MSETYTCEGCGGPVRPDEAVVVESFFGFSGPGWIKWAHPECAEEAKRELEERADRAFEALFHRPPLPRRVRQCGIDPDRLRNRTLYLASEATLRTVVQAVDSEKRDTQ